MSKDKLNEEQYKHYLDIIKLIEQNYKDGDFDNVYSLITGKAGTGKSFLASTLVKYFEQNPLNKKQVQCTALTHKALNELKKKLVQSNVDLDKLNGVSTVHSYFKIKATINTQKGIEEFKVQNFGPKTRPCSILFIDEVSMLDEELFKLIKSQSHLYSSIVLVGDEFQVPPVNTSEYNLFQDKNIKKFKLNNIVRQAKDNPIIQIASEIVTKIENEDYKDVSFCIKLLHKYSEKYNEIIFTKDTKEFINEYFNFVKTDIEKPILESKFNKALLVSFTNATVNSLNSIAKIIRKQTKLINYIDIHDLLITQAPVFDPYLPDTIVLQNNTEFFIKDMEESTYEGVPVYVLYNEDDIMIRVVKEDSYSQNLYRAKINNLSSMAKLDGRLWKQYFDFKKCFTEIKHSFACTVHKSQGSTVDRVFVDLKDMPWNNDIDLAFRLTYVAITRTSDVLVLKN